MNKHILVAVGVGYSETALNAAIERARENHARLTALHVVDRLPWWATASIESDCGRTLAYIEQEANRLMQRTLETIRKAEIDGACITIDLQSGMTISRVIARAARELDADLIVVGRSKAPHWRFWEERVSNALRCHSNRRVLIASDDADTGGKQPRPTSVASMASSSGV